MDPEHLIVLGETRATVRGLVSDVAEIKDTLKGQDDKLDLLLKLHHERRGAVRFGKGVIALITSSGIVGWLWGHLHK